MRGSRESTDVDGVPDAIDAIGHRSPSPVGSTSRSSLHRYNYGTSSSSHRENASDELVSHSKFESRAQMASASQESKELVRNNHIRSGLKTVHTQKVIRKTTTISLGERKDSTHVKVRDEMSTFFPSLFQYFILSPTNNLTPFFISSFFSFNCTIIFNSLRQVYSCDRCRMFSLFNFTLV